MASGERIFIRIDQERLTHDAIDDYAEDMWRALMARMKEESCQ